MLKRDGLLVRIFGLSLVLLGFYLLATNFPYVLGLLGREHGVVMLIGFIIGTMIAFGGYLAAGYDPKKAMEPLTIGWLSVIFIIPILYLPLPKDVRVIALGFSTFIPLLLWVGYTKLKAKIQRKSRREEGGES